MVSKRKRNEIKLKWNGSLEAQRQHQEAVSASGFGRTLQKNKGRGKTSKGKLKQGHQNHPNIPYAEYLQTKWWLLKRKQKKASVGWKCERCGNKDRSKLVVHHLHYKTLWREKNKDLEVLCDSCHKMEHEALVQANSHLDSISRQIL